MNERNKKLLFVDDEPNILHMLERLLHQCTEGWEGEFCQSADEALRAMARTEFDTVVSDIRMPGKDGLALLRAMQEGSRTRRIPVIILTGESDRALKSRALDMGATDLLNKPVNRDDLLARIRNALRLKEYEDQLANRVEILDGLVRARTQQLERSHREVVWRLAKACEFRDDQTGNHIARVAGCARILAQGLEMEDNTADLLLQASSLHDIGKIGIPDAILLKPGPLTAEERAVMERHPVIGEEILSSAPKAIRLLGRPAGAPATSPEDGGTSPLLQMACRVARSHHEKWDGSGYPDGLEGADIPIEARIVALTDVYDALRSSRPYKTAMPDAQAKAILREGAGLHFDPELVGVFFQHAAKIADLYLELCEPAHELSLGGIVT